MGLKTMKSFWLGLGAGAVAVAAVWGVFVLTAEDPRKPLRAERALPLPAKDTGVLDLICELSLNVEGQVALGLKDQVPSRMTLAQVDFDKKSGWFQGKIAISESRAGALTVLGHKLQVARPAMFERFGVMITREEFVIDRKDGHFEQTITTRDGRTISLISGNCAQVIKAPF
jgi:hypothetical protein